MLDMMRHHSQSTLIYLIFGAIIVVFALSFGPGSSSCQGPGGGYAAKVDGEVIRQQDFSVRLAQQLDYIRQSSNNTAALSEDFVEKLGIRKQIIDGLIDSKLLELEARKRGLKANDDELVEYLQTRYGVKDVSYQQYSNWISRQFQLSVSQFEERARGEIVADKLRQILTENISISDKELRENYWREHDRVMVTFVKFDTAEQDAEKVSSETISSFIKENSDDLKKRYEKEQFKYRTPQMVQARQILRRLARDASDAEIAKESTFLKQLQEQIAQGADFAALAKEHSQDEASASKGGDLGLIKRGQTIKPLENEIFSLKTNELSKEPIKSPLGVHLVQVVEIQPPANKPLEEVQELVAESILQDQQKEILAQNQANTFLNKLQAGTLLKEISQEEGGEDKTKPVRKTTPWIQKDEINIPRVGSSEEFHLALFTLTENSPITQKIYKVGRSYFIGVLKERESPSEDKFNTDLEELRRQGAWSKQTQVFKYWLKNLRDNADIKFNTDLFPGLSDQAV